MAATRNLQVALRWYHRTGIPDPWDLDRVNRADWDNGAHHQAAAPPEAPAEPQPEAQADVAVPPADFPEEAEAPTPVLNRKQRRAAGRKANTGRRGTSKPPKPPPKQEPTADGL